MHRLQSALESLLLLISDLPNGFSLQLNLKSCMSLWEPLTLVQGSGKDTVGIWKKNREMGHWDRSRTEALSTLFL